MYIRIVRMRFVCFETKKGTLASIPCDSPLSSLLLIDYAGVEQALGSSMWPVLPHMGTSQHDIYCVLINKKVYRSINQVSLLFWAFLHKLYIHYRWITTTIGYTTNAGNGTWKVERDPCEEGSPSFFCLIVFVPCKYQCSCSLLVKY